MTWKEVGAAIGTWAPAIGAALSPVTGGTSALIGGAIGAITKALGLAPDAKPDDVMKIITTDPEVRLKMMIAENDFEIKKRDQDLQQRKTEIDELSARLKDVQGAREKEVAIAQATGSRDISGEVFDWLITFGFFVVLGVRMFIEIPQTQMENVGLLLGVLGTAFITVVNYKRGSSQSSAEKSEMMSRMRQSLRKGE